MRNWFNLKALHNFWLAAKHGKHVRVSGVIFVRRAIGWLSTSKHMKTWPR